MNRIARHIPNTITCCNLLSGCIAVVNALGGDIRKAFLWIAAGALFDFCDGLSARLLHAYSPIGKELDSLADLVTFGLAPSLVCMYTLGRVRWPESLPADILPYISLAIAAASALRLAKFNIDDRQTSSFLGLAVPADALFWCGTCLWLDGNAQLLGKPAAGFALIACIPVMCTLMLCELPMFSLKFKNLKLGENLTRYIFLAGAAAAVCLWGAEGAAPAVLFYIFMSVVSAR